MIYLYVALGGAIGAAARYGTGLWFAANFGAGSVFPWPTLAINIAGSFLIGLIWSLYAEAEWFVNWGRAFLVVGLLGGFTTFSTFSWEVMQLLTQQKALLALAYIGLSVGVCVLGVWLALQITRMFV